jgi:HAD superfamily hydrolase (TIGR01662 family)
MRNEIVIIMGYPACGKTTVATSYTDLGYKRFNRDNQGGSLNDIANEVDLYLQSNKTNVVLDNTYGTIESRKSIIEVAKKHKYNIFCNWLTASLEESQINACRRMINKGIGCCIDSDQYKTINDPNVFPNFVLFHHRNRFEEPTVDEGFTNVILTRWNRVWGNEYKNKAIILDYDGTLRESVGPHPWPIKIEDVKLLNNRIEILNKYKDDGYILLGASNQSCISKGLSEVSVIDCFEETNRLLGLKIEYLYCKHSVPPISCYCRKPHVGMGVTFIEKHKLNPALCTMVGDQTSDKTFATRCGFKFSHADTFFN